MACRYPDADSPEDLWRNVLAGRRAFRRLPDERMRQEDYYSPDPTAPDRFYSAKAAVIEGFAFDRVKYRIAGSTFRSTDMTHWLALDTAARALEDAGFPEGRGLTGKTTGVVIGNTLTGEFARANLMRLRWPYVRRTVGAALRDQGWDDEALSGFLDRLEQRYKAPFPEIDEDTLAGGLANTIAGRVCNHFDFQGGGFTVDGACSSSLLSVATACDALASGKLDTAIAGGVDLSIDPFEVIGFAKTGALAKSEMRVYDKNSNGFWPGEGCGMLVLMRDEDAVGQNLTRHAVIAGWGYSSDGKGGMTRPEASGHRLAVERAYATAGFGFETVSYLEGHGTGTAVGDATELRALSEARRAADPNAPAAAISTVKGNFGHTKAAAGVAGLLKAVLAVRHQIIPPATGHADPHPELTGADPALRVPGTAELWPEGAPIRAGVSSMGFGGINAHLVVEHGDGARETEIGQTTKMLVRSRQDSELLLLDADSVAGLRGRVAQLAAFCAKLSFAEVGDLAATLSSELAGRPLRAAVIATAPEEAERKFGKLLTLLDGGARAALDTADGVFLGSSATAPRIGFLFPGQGAGRRADGGALRRRFETVDELYQAHPLPAGDLVATEVAQPRIVTASVAGLRVLTALGIEAAGAAGHSLGELTALHWAGAMDETTLLGVAAARGRIMAEVSDGTGAMAGIAAPPDAVQALLAGEPVVIAGYNSPAQTVVSGPADAVERVTDAAAARGLGVTRIAVSHAFHSEQVAPAAAGLYTHLSGESFQPLRRTLVSTVTADKLPPDTDVPELLARQVREPVRFADAVAILAADADLLIEVGPGRVLRGLAGEIAPAVPAVSMESDSPSLSGLLRTVAAAYVLGAPVRHGVLFDGRYTRPLPLDKEFTFFASPCESAPDDVVIGGPGIRPQTLAAPRAHDAGTGLDPGVRRPEPAAAGRAGADALEVLLRLAAERAELPLEAVRADSNPLDELHLSSITVGQIVNQACRELGISAPAVTSAFATSTLAELAEALEELSETAPAAQETGQRAAGVAPWVRAFAVDSVAVEAGPAVDSAGSEGRWRLFATDRHPLAGTLHQALQRARLGDGVLLCLPRNADEGHTLLMVRAARAALSAAGPMRFVVVGDRRGAAGLAKTLHLEAPAVATTVVTLPLPPDLDGERVAEAVPRILADIAATAGFSEIEYDAAGVRRQPVLRALPISAAPRPASPLGSGDVVLVTGGGKGITAESALALAIQSGARIGLLGRSEAARDPELAANLERMEAAGVGYLYVRADVTIVDEVKAAVEEIRRTLGPVTAVLHGAGRNVPVALTGLDEASFRRTLAPKISGLEAVLTAVDPAALKLLVTFGSIIGRAGLRGQADYATANDWMTDLTRRFQEDFPDCKCLAVEWSVWSGTGMGERLGVLESLLRDGVDPIPAADGVAMLTRLIADPDAPTSVVVMGRAEGLPTITMERGEVPLRRFLERVQVHYPGIEIVVDSDLSADGDLYLADHLLDGDLLFPAVFGMEAMVQAASVLVEDAGGPGSARAPVFEDMEFLRPIVVPVGGTVTVRIAALAVTADAVRVVIRSSDTGFQADHFRATVRYSGAVSGQDRPLVTDRHHAELLPLDPATELYGPVLFQGSRFQRLVGYRRLAATSCVAELSTKPLQPWFGTFLPSELLLADPGTRDAVMHSIQCCVPDATLLPSGIERLTPADPETIRGVGRVTLHADERSRDGDTYVYDVDVRDPDGALLERWEGLTLQAVHKRDGAGPWAPVLLGPFLERRSELLLPTPLRVAVRPDGDEAGGSAPVDGVVANGIGLRRSRTAKAVGALLGPDGVVRYRPDGKPEAVGGFEISSAHGAGVTFTVAGTGAAAADVEVVTRRTAEDWAGLLGPDGYALARLVAREQDEDQSVAATRVWGAIEAVRKTGRARADLAVAGGRRADRWVLFDAGDARIATFPTALRGIAEPVVFTMLAGPEEGEC
jgi:enediyne polyketide synthase